MRVALATALFLALALALAAPAAASDGFVSVQDFQFAPESVQVEPGEKVQFNLEGPESHSATLNAGQIDRYESGTTGPASQGEALRPPGPLHPLLQAAPVHDG